MISLRGRPAQYRLDRPLERNVFRLVTEPADDIDLDAQAILVRSEADSSRPGHPLYVFAPGVSPRQTDGSMLELPPELGYLAAGDVVSVSWDLRAIRVAWRATGRQNSFLLTERCDNYCLMCSQPPRTRVDDFLLDETMEVIRLLPTASIAEIGFTGGEPTLYGDRFLDLLRLCKEHVPEAPIHILSNGRRFADAEFASAFAGVDHPDAMVGIPLYGAEPSLHDYVVQAHGAFDETVRGVLRLAERGQRIELRVVLHKQTAPAIVDIADFISRNLPFVDQVALMGLEMMGLARRNISEVWIDPWDYRDRLTDAAFRLHGAGIRTLIYNHQLCLLEPSARRFAVQSISDWKNEYLPVCHDCTARSACGGFFASAKYRVSEWIRPIPELESLAPRVSTSGVAVDVRRRSSASNAC